MIRYLSYWDRPEVRARLLEHYRRMARSLYRAIGGA